MNAKASTLAFLLGTALLANAAEWYVSPTANASGTGSSSNPWQLQTALNHPPEVRPGDTIWLRGGTYTGSFVSLLNGTAAAPIIVRQALNERATIDGQGQFDTQTMIFSVKGSHVWFWGFEVMSSNPKRETTVPGSAPTGEEIPYGNGVEIDQNVSSVTGVKFINMIVHDTRQGFSLWMNASDIEVYGCLAYYNGWIAPDRGHGHALYSQNRTGMRWIRNCVFFNQFSKGIQIYGGSVAYLDNHVVQDNILALNGDVPGTDPSHNLLMGGSRDMYGAVISRNRLFATMNSQFQLGYNNPAVNAIMTDNFIVGPATCWYLSPVNLTLTGNTLDANQSVLDRGSYPNNTFIWGEPTSNSVFVHPNFYEPTKANVVVYNFENLSTVSVDLSGVIAPDHHYELRNVQDYFNDTIRGVNTTAGMINIPMTGRTITRPSGWTAPNSSFPKFGIFVASDLGPAAQPSGNTAPTITTIANTTVNANTATPALAFTIGDSQTAATSLTLTRASSNTSLVPVANIVLGGSGANRTVTVTPAANQSGTATITLTVSDGSLSTSTAFTLTVNPPNTAPTISSIANTTVNANTATPALAFTIGDSQTAATSLTLTRASSNTSLVPVANIVLGGSGANRTVTVTPAANQSGTASITLTVSDGSLSTSTAFTLTVNPPNTAPTISSVANTTVNANTATPALAFTIGDSQTAATSLTLTRASSNTSLVPVANIVLGGSGANRTVTVTPAANQSGTASITLTVSDGSLSTSTAFTLTVNPPNTAPTISSIASTTVNANTATPALAFTIGDSQTAATSLTLTRASSNTSLVPVANIVLGGSGANRTVTVTPAANQSGTATITLTVSDGSLSTSTAFTLTVNPLNTAPTISSIASATVNANTATPALAFTVGDSQTAATSLTLTRASSNTSLVPVANIVLGGSGANRTVTVTPATDQSGTATITLTVSDGSLSTSTAFTLTVNPPNTAPTISSIASTTVDANTATPALAFTIGDSQTAATSLTLTRASSNTSLVPVANIVLGGSGANRTVTVTPATDQSGTATITLTVSDGSLSTSTAFTLTVNPLNTAPTISSIANITVNVNTATPALAFTVGDSQTAATSLTLTRASSNTSLVPVANIVLGGSGANRTVTVTPATDQSGTATVRITVSDGALSTSAQFTLTVNSAPTITSILDTTIEANTATAPLAFTIGDSQTAATSLTLTRASSNTSLVPVANIVLGGSGANRTVTITPASNQSGSATITITVSDGSLTASAAFVLTVQAPASQVYVSLEAESAVLVQPMQAGASPIASGQSYVASSVPESGTATLSVQIPRTGEYVIWCRIRSVNDVSDSLYVSVDGGPEDVFDTAENAWSGNWQWTRVNGRGGGGPLTLNPRLFTLQAGPHQITFRGREANTALDKILVTTDQALSVPPTPRNLQVATGPAS